MRAIRRATAGPTSAARPGRTGSVDLGAAAVLAAALGAFFLFVYPWHHLRFPVGPDGPVYLWWVRLAAHDGLSAIGDRPGAPALALVLDGSLRLPLPSVLAAVGAASGAALGLSAAALVRRSGCSRATWMLVGVLGGTFAVHLADGYTSNLVQAATFVGAAAVLVTRPGGEAGGRRRTAAAAVLLAAGALAHPLFAVLGAGILLGAGLVGGWPALRAGNRRPAVLWNALPDESRRVAIATFAGAALAVVGFLAIQRGPGTLPVDTSKDAFLRRAGLAGSLHHAYLVRLVQHLARYVLPISLPLAVWGALAAGGFLRRLLVSWAAIAAAGVLVSATTGVAPSVRLFAFAYALPVGAGIGLARLGGAVHRRRRWLAVPLVLGLGAAMVAGAWITWLRARPFVSDLEATRAAAAGAAARALPAGTPLVFVVDNGKPTITFFAVRAGNVLRDAVPPDRIRDVHVYVGTPTRYLQGRPTLDGDPFHDAMSRLYLHDIEAAGGPPVAFVVAPFDRPGWAQAGGMGTRVAPGVIELGNGSMVRRAAAGTPSNGGILAPVAASSPWRFVLAGALGIALLWAVGLGWTLAAVGDRGDAALLAPAFGIAGLLLAGIVGDAVGVPSTGAGPPVLSAAVAAGGYLTAWRSKRVG